MPCSGVPYFIQDPVLKTPAAVLGGPAADSVACLSTGELLKNYDELKQSYRLLDELYSFNDDDVAKEEELRKKLAEVKTMLTAGGEPCGQPIERSAEEKAEADRQRAADLWRTVDPRTCDHFYALISIGGDGKCLQCQNPTVWQELLELTLFARASAAILRG